MGKYELIQEDNGDGKVYLIDCGRRRWLRDSAIVKSLGLRWPEDVRMVAKDELSKIAFGPPVPLHNWDRVGKKLQTMEDAREYIVSSAKGSGVEFGAAANPMPVPVGSKVQYADIFSTLDLKEELYSVDEEFEYVPLDIKSSFDTMVGIEDSTLDFIIASHVIEHVRDPIGAILLSMKKLRSSGRLILIIPKKERTLDSSRELTSIEHLSLDHVKPNRERDALHVVEFHAYAKPENIKAVYQKAIQSISDDNHSMHYHTWNEDTFADMLKYISGISKVFQVETFLKALKGKSNYEFYVVLLKI